MTGFRLLADSSVWLSYFLAASEEARGVIDSEENILYTSTLTLHEVKRRLLRLKKTVKQADAATTFIKENSVITPVDEEIALSSVTHCLKHRLHTVDAIIYETARQNKCTLATGDNDFKNLKNVKIIS